MKDSDSQLIAFKFYYAFELFYRKATLQRSRPTPQQIQYQARVPMGWGGSLQWIRDETIRNAGKQSSYAVPSLQMELWGHVREIFQAEELAFGAMEVRMQRTLERSLRHTKESVVVALGYNPKGLSKRLLHRIPTLGVPFLTRKEDLVVYWELATLIASPARSAS